jgi:hypothetical protein
MSNLGTGVTLSRGPWGSPYDCGMQKHMRAVVAGAALCVAVGMSGCSPATEFAPPPSASSTSEPTTPATTPTPSTPAVAEPASCDAVLNEAGHEDLAADNLTPRDFTIQSWDYPLLATFETDGVVCKWAGGGDVYVVLGQLPMGEAAWKSTRAGLEAEGYAANEEYGVDGFLDGPDSHDESYPSRGFVWHDGILYYVSYPGIIEFVSAFQS